MTRLTARPGHPLYGTAMIPGDKSISHRAIMLGAIADGITEIDGLLLSDDVRATAEAVEKMGAKVTMAARTGQKTVIHGCGVSGLLSPPSTLDMGNSGTSTRLLAGLVAGRNITARFIGDESLSQRPMRRVTDPLTEMGAVFEFDDARGTLPMTIRPGRHLTAIDYILPVASAQVKSAVLLAALMAEGETHIHEPIPTRDHTENMLQSFGADIDVISSENGATDIYVQGGQVLSGQSVTVPADPSSAAFLTVAALITPGSEIYMPGVGMNPRRDGLYRTLIEMGADIRIEGHRIQAGEPVADITACYSPLTAVNVPADRAASMIDEYPVLFVAAAFADGTSRMEGLRELTVKESNRLALMAAGLKACGVDCTAGRDSMTINGCGTGGHVPGGAIVQTAMDHRIAMSFLVLGMAAEQPVTIDDARPIRTSFPNFPELVMGLGGDLS